MPPFRWMNAPSGSALILFFAAYRSTRDHLYCVRLSTFWPSAVAHPLVVEAVNHLNVRSCLIDGEVVRCDEKGVAAFQLLRHRWNEPLAFLYAFDLLELNRRDLRRETIEVSKGDPSEHPPQEPPRVCLNEHLEHPDADLVFRHACKMALEGIISKRLGSRHRSGRSPDWVKFKN